MLDSLHSKEGVKMSTQKSILALAIGLSLSHVSAQEGPKLIGYFPSWSHHAKPHFGPEKIPYSKWTRITYAFIQTDLKGGLHGMRSEDDVKMLFGPQVKGKFDPQKHKQIVWTSMYKPESPELEKEYNLVQPDTLRGMFKKGEGLIDRAHAAGVEVFASIGGWTLSANFPPMAADAKARERFASESVRLIREYGFDGIDIDWEFPGYTDHKGTPADKQNYVLLMGAIQDSLTAYGKVTGRKYPLTAALPCSNWFRDMGIDVPALLPILDGWNLMTYDLHGTWDKVAGHNSPMYSPDGLSVDACANNYMALGVPASKIQIGAGFYGRHFAGSQKIGDTHQGEIKEYTGEKGGNYAAIAERIRMNELTRHWDDSAKAPYAVGKLGLVSYEDPQSLAIKAQYVKDKKLGGLIVWEMSGDLMPNGNFALIDALQGMRK
jgi:chitinase